MGKPTNPESAATLREELAKLVENAVGDDPCGLNFYSAADHILTLLRERGMLDADSLIETAIERCALVCTGMKRGSQSLNPESELAAMNVRLQEAANAIRALTPASIMESRPK